MQRNTKPAPKRAYTHGGSPAYAHLTPLQTLRRSVLACMLWEDQFYEDGQSIADRITALAAQVDPNDLAALADEARNAMHLRHAPLMLVTALAKTGRGRPKLVSDTLFKVIQRADELSEFMALYWRNGKTPIAKQVKKGLARAFQRFDAYQLAKYDRERVVRLRDVLFLIHAKPKDEAQAALWKRLVDGTLPAPDTWEVALSTGGDKREEFERLLREGKLGYLALLRNLRNMEQAGVSRKLVIEAIRARKGARHVLPFRYVAAARAAPAFAPALDEAMQASVAELPMLPGTTLVLVDVSASMKATLSGKSDLSRMDAAAALAAIVRGEDVRVFTFADRIVEVPRYPGLGGIKAVVDSQPHGCTRLAEAVRIANAMPHDRLIVITDEQGTDGVVPKPVAERAYMLNVASSRNGIGYGKGWTANITGFSERVLHYIAEVESTFAD